MNDDASLDLTEGWPPFTGSFRPNEPLSGFDSLAGVGTWELLLEDVYPDADDGELTAWTLTLGGRIGGRVVGTVTSLASGSRLRGVRVEAVETTYYTVTDSEGRHAVPLDAAGLASGAYFLHMTAAQFTASSKLVLIR